MNQRPSLFPDEVIQDASQSLQSSQQPQELFQKELKNHMSDSSSEKNNMLDDLGHRGTVMTMKSAEDNIFRKQDTQSIFVKGDKNVFPEGDSSSSEENMIGGLGNNLKKEVSTIMTTIPDSNHKIFESDDEDQIRNGSTSHFQKEELKNSEIESSNEDAEILKGEADFTDSDEDDLTNRFSRQIFGEGDKELPGTLVVNNVQNEMQIRSVSVSRPSIRKDILTSNDSHCDYMEKQSPNILKQWQKRYFVLEKRILKYFKNKEEYTAQKPPKGVINFQQIWVKPEFKEDAKKIDLIVQGSKRVFYLRCQDKNQYDQWAIKLKHSIYSSNGFKKELRLDHYIEDISKFFDFWRFLRISEDAFIKQAEVGDIILCQSKKKLNMRSQMNQKSQNCVDKICLVVKLQTGVPEQIKDEVFVIRVGTSFDYGIVIESWEQFRVHKSQNYSDCWFRHLYCDRNDTFLQKTQNFVQRIREKPFVVKKNEIGGEEPELRRLYKNAELIAKYYKYVGFLPPKGSADFKENIKFEAKDFSINPKFLDSASFGDEHIIMFKEKELKQKIQHIQNQVEWETNQQILRAKTKHNDKINMSIINEEDIEHTIKMQRKQFEQQSFISSNSSNINLK